AGALPQFAVTYDGVTQIARLYVDGQLASPEKSMGAGTPDTAASGYLYLGNKTDDLRFPGSLDEFTLYKRPLSEAELTAIALAGANGKTLPDDNLPPVVSAGPDQRVAGTAFAANLLGTVSDDNKPFGAPAIVWSQDSGPGTVAFADPASP